MEYPFSAREYNKSSGAIGEIIFYSVSKNLNFHGVYGVRCNKSMRSSVLRSRKFTISMKYLLLLMLISFLSIVDAQNPQLSILNTVLTDSTIARYVSVYGGIGSSHYALSGDKGNFFFTMEESIFRFLFKKNQRIFPVSSRN